MLAINANGNSAPSSSANGAALSKTIPNVPAAPTTANSGNNVAITWAAPSSGGENITAYTISIRQKDGTTYTTAGCIVTPIECSSCTCSVTIATLKAAPFNLVSGDSVLATVIATNKIGSSAASSPGNGAVLPSIPSAPTPQTTTISIPSVPSAPTTSVNSNTSVTITWVAPSDGGSAITAYTVAIRRSDGITFTTELTHCNVSTTTCTVPISVLQAPPYTLTWGASIFATVAARNDEGISDASAPGNGAIIITNPDPPSLLANNAAITSASVITLTWTQPAVNGGTAVIDYQVSWDQGISTYVVLASGITTTSYSTTAALTD